MGQDPRSLAQRVGQPVSENIPLLPVQSEGSIRVADTVAIERRAKTEQRARRRPVAARLIIALVALIIGGICVWMQTHQDKVTVVSPPR